MSPLRISGVYCLQPVFNAVRSGGCEKFKLRIPNLEIRDIFKTQIMEYFKESVAKRRGYAWQIL